MAGTAAAATAAATRADYQQSVSFRRSHPAAGTRRQIGVPTDGPPTGRREGNLALPPTGRLQPHIRERQMTLRLSFPARNATALRTGIAVALLAGCTTSPGGEPVPLWLGAVSTNGPTVPVAVSSWKDRKFENLVRQQTDFSCGAAVMATIFNFAFARQTTEQQVLVNMLRIADPDIVRQKGFSLLDMKTYAESVGYQADGYRVDYDTLKRLEVPSVALLDIRGYKHFVVVRRAWADRVAIGDPALGNRTMSRGEFEAAWNQIIFVVAGEGYVPGNLLQPPKPLSAGRLLDLYASMPGAEVVEFGFGPRFSF